MPSMEDNFNYSSTLTQSNIGKDYLVVGEFFAKNPLKFNGFISKSSRIPEKN
jgi:hypothetical protein